MEVSMIDIASYFQEQEFNCEKHGISKVYVFKDAKPYCPVCSAEATKAKEELQKKIEIQKQQELQKKAVEANFNQAMIPPRFQTHSFETFIATTQEQKKNKQAMENYAKNFNENLAEGVSVILAGKVGNGKTHLACAVANHIIRNLNKTALFLSAIDAFSKIKATYTKKSEITEIQAINQFLDIDLLILDEFGVQIGSEHERMLLFRIINKRYEYLKPTILISNLSALEIKNFEERIFDRLKENGILLAFSGESNRKSKKI
jgi:DNA replication protein DnaC